MKKWIILIVLVSFMLPSAQAGIGVFGSWWDSKDYGSLYGAGVRLGMEVFSGLGIEARASYLSSDLFKNNDLTMNVIPLEAAVSWTFNVSDTLKPYIGAGVGYYMKDVDVEEDDFWKDAQDCVGYFAMAGLNFVLGPSTIFAEAKYNLIEEDDEFRWRGSDVKETRSLDGISVNAGIKFGF
ncbi:MAG: OmpW family outer membrane protein [Kiritimatiellia bacterium]|nr:OmpW family outer membrane protein [Kiritimatiellia bacterium]